MNRVLVVATLAAPLLLACSPEAKGHRMLKKYETAFSICKEETSKQGMTPGSHRCSTIVSMAVEMSLRDVGLQEAEWQTMLAKWLDETGYKAYYIPPDKRR